MGYFARVTKRVFPEAAGKAAGKVEGVDTAAGKVEGVVEGVDTASKGSKKRRRVNAVIMGRRTWDSIPHQYRPLKGRVNVVVTRDRVGFWGRLRDAGEGGGDGLEGPIVVSSVTDALAKLQNPVAYASLGSKGKEWEADVDRIFVIGGASIYSQALRLKEARHVLLTRIGVEYECDTFFEGDLEGAGWRKAELEELRAFTGEEFDEEGENGAVQEENGVGFEFCLYNRVE